MSFAPGALSTQESWFLYSAISGDCVAHQYNMLLGLMFHPMNFHFLVMCFKNRRFTGLDPVIVVAIVISHKSCASNVHAHIFGAFDNILNNSAESSGHHSRHVIPCF
ncbi:hypothetical protein Mfla_2735 [Methylobacillus flagellatus KT]|uniref:Uncharacterized protein n=1 Tax=Methylobacillus flagellatus (strain ATCC 51484 / DSM 6875 / VKM B-1610 / KT) TaxID=265072 RepID=Q1GXN9_METFK|nr:hypothetical protein Mfla_2735 [Methylobacillus flagellatus KT]